MKVKDLSDLMHGTFGQDNDRQTCMSIHINDSDKFVEIILDTSCENYYLECIPGEADGVGLLRDAEHNHVIGVNLPLKQRKIHIDCDGSLQIVNGFVDDTDKPDS